MFASKAKINMWAECGDDYYFGRDGETVDYEMAMSFYKKAAEKKHPHACYMFGVCLEKGYGIEKDKPAAKDWYEKAAEYGDENARKRLAEGGLNDDELEYSSRLLSYLQQEAEINGFWMQNAVGQRDIDCIMTKMSLPIGSNDALTHRDFEKLLKDRRKNGLSGNGDYAVLTLALLAIKARLGENALFHSDTVRAYLTDLLPQINEMRQLSALVFGTDAINFLRNEPHKALDKLKARGISSYEAERLIECFAVAFAVTVEYMEPIKPINK
jgi:hypothetical protein